MAIEHKGLRKNFLQFKQNMDALQAAIVKGNEIAPAMTADISSMVEQVAAYQDDLKFMGEVLGNGSGNGSDSQASPPVSPAVAPVIQASVAISAPAASASPANTSPETHTRDSTGNIIEK